MALLTPPNSSHRGDKENKCPVAGPSTRSVVWTNVNDVLHLSTPWTPQPINSKQRPLKTRSILKRSNQALHLDVPVASKQREVTPEPSAILEDQHYLDYPVSQIINVDDPNSQESMAQLIEGYNVLACRLRSGIAESTDADASWPLFRPLAKNAEAFVDAVVRDLGRARVDPLSLSPNGEENSPPKFPLPSPQKSPEKKRGGMTGEQVKCARDLCTTCHSVIKSLAVILSLPAIYSVFDDKQLRRILTAILAIPLSEDLRALNARKTCALSIWLIQVQRLPAPVLQPAADRIAYALRRGIDGELGKEGKKGSANDGLKAISDLCEHLPAIFVPAFVPLVPSILCNLTANTLVLRTQACCALGGFALGLTSLPLSPLHTKVSSTVAAYISAIPTPSPIKSSSPPTKSTSPPTKSTSTPSKFSSPKKVTEAAIIRTLRATMNHVEPEQAAQGPVWAISVLASLIVLLNSRLCTDSKANRIVSTLLGLGLGHNKSSIRALTCLAWRTITWSYFQPPLPAYNDEESEVDDDIREQRKGTKEAHRRTMMTVVDCQTGVVTMGAFLGDESSKSSSEPLRQAIGLLQCMARKSPQSCFDSTQVMMQLVSAANGEAEEQDAWDHKALLPKLLFTPATGLFTAEFKEVFKVVRPLYEGQPTVHEIRPLTRDEMSKDWVMGGIMAAWKVALGCLELGDEVEMPTPLAKTWAGLLNANVTHLCDNDEEAEIPKFAMSAMKYLIDILEDPQLSLVPSNEVEAVGPANKKLIPDSDDPVTSLIVGGTTCSNSELRLRIVRCMWALMKDIFPHDSLSEASETLLACLMKNSSSLLPKSTLYSLSDEDESGRTRANWVSLCVDALGMCDTEAMKVFWGCEDDAPVQKVDGAWGWDWTEEFTNAVWRTSVESWKEGKGHWEGAVVLLGVPFTDRHTWNLTSDDFNLWEEFLDFATGDALDRGLESSDVLDNIASFVLAFQTPGVCPHSTRLADLLLCHLDVEQMRALPLSVVGFVSETMRASYFSEKKNKQVMNWLARSLTSLIDNCPAEFCSKILQTVQEGLCLWLADEFAVWDENEATYNMLPLYHHTLLRLQGLPDPISTLETFSDIVASIFRHRVTAPAAEAFNEFWKLASIHLTVPEDGWPSGVAHALRTVGLLPAEEDQVMEGATATASLAPSFIVNSAPRTPVSASYSTPPTAVLRREAQSRIPSPQRPHKVFGSFPIIPSSPVSPTVRRRSRLSSSSSTSSAAPRTPLSAIQVQESPSKRRRLSSEEGKENASLNKGPLVSVAERIAEMLKPNSNLKKRKLDADQDDIWANSSASTPLKKLKGRMKPKTTKPAKNVVRMPSPAPSATSFCSNESEEERRWVEDALEPTTGVPFPSMDVEGEAELNVETVPRRKRDDGMFGAASDPRFLPPPKIDLRKLQRTLKRSVSVPQAMLHAISCRKRKRTESELDDDAELYDLTRSDPLPALQISTSQPHLSLARRTCSMPSAVSPTWPDSDATVVPSSDDDPHLGQVTPHHLISPAMQKKEFTFVSSYKALKTSAMEELFGPDGSPQSGDSVTSASSEEDSPTKEVVNRSLQRMGSGSRFFKTVLSQ